MSAGATARLHFSKLWVLPEKPSTGVGELFICKNAVILLTHQGIYSLYKIGISITERDAP